MDVLAILRASFVALLKAAAKPTGDFGSAPPTETISNKF